MPKPADLVEAELIEGLVQRYPALAPYLLPLDSRLLQHVNLYDQAHPPGGDA